MKSIFITALAIMAALCMRPEPAAAFYSRGAINNNLAYEDLRITQPRSGRTKVAGTLINKTGRALKVKGTLQFRNIHKEVLNSATISETIPPDGSVHFSRPLKAENAIKIQHAYAVYWAIEDQAPAPKRGPSLSRNADKPSVGYATTRDTGRFIQVTGCRNHPSEPFQLKEGVYLAKVTHAGGHRCRVELLRTGGGPARLLASGSGEIVASKAVRIDHQENYLLNVSADGDWSTTLEYQDPQKDAGADLLQRAPPSGSPGQSGAPHPVVIKLKNGRTLRADACWADGDDFKASIYNGMIRVNQKDVLEIISPAP